MLVDSALNFHKKLMRYDDIFKTVIFYEICKNVVPRKFWTMWYTEHTYIRTLQCTTLKHSI